MVWHHQTEVPRVGSYDQPSWITIGHKMVLDLDMGEIQSGLISLPRVPSLYLYVCAWIHALWCIVMLCVCIRTCVSAPCEFFAPAAQRWCYRSWSGIVSAMGSSPHCKRFHHHNTALQSATTTLQWAPQLWRLHPLRCLCLHSAASNKMSLRGVTFYGNAAAFLPSTIPLSLRPGGFDPTLSSALTCGIAIVPSA